MRIFHMMKSGSHIYNRISDIQSDGSYIGNESYSLNELEDEEGFSEEIWDLKGYIQSLEEWGKKNGYLFEEISSLIEGRSNQSIN